MSYFSDRELGSIQRPNTELSRIAWRGIAVVVTRLIKNGSFGFTYPEECPDGEGIVGTDEVLLKEAVTAEIPNLGWPPLKADQPGTHEAMDLLEFCWDRIGEPIRGRYHSFYDHYHLDFEPKATKGEFVGSINRILGRNGIGLALGADGKVVRLTPSVLADPLAGALFKTGDNTLDALLETARQKFTSRDEPIRQEAMEKLWDAFERLKTLEGGDKKTSVQALLANAIREPNLRARVEAELSELTSIGNSFMIRHTETTKTPISDSDHVDYLFHRMFAVIRLLLRTTNRGG
jgi:hypothetical protein